MKKIAGDIEVNCHSSLSLLLLILSSRDKLS